MKPRSLLRRWCAEANLTAEHNQLSSCHFVNKRGVERRRKERSLIDLICLDMIESTISITLEPVFFHTGYYTAVISTTSRPTDQGPYTLYISQLSQTLALPIRWYHLVAPIIMDAVPTDPLARFVFRHPPSSVQNQPERVPLHRR
jgi:hypothetical protein